MPNFISMTSNAPGRVDIQLDLSAYIEAFEATKHAHGEDKESANRTFNLLYGEMLRQVNDIPGQLKWVDALALATRSLDEHQRSAIETSPAVEMLNNSFVEILKNTMDEIISKHYDSHSTEKPLIHLFLHIDNVSNPDLVTVKITDSGRGFEQNFLEKLQTKVGRDGYVNASRGSIKRKHPDRPPFFGGQGRGLRILIADEEGDVLERGGARIHRFVKPDVSRVDFDNAVDKYGHIQGAQITITTSIQPRESLSQRAERIKNQVQAHKRGVYMSNAIKTESISSEETLETRTTETSPLTLDLDEDLEASYESDSSKFSQNSSLQLDLSLINEEDTDEEDFSDDGYVSPKP